jgi:hypothetical protein
VAGYGNFDKKTSPQKRGRFQNLMKKRKVPKNVAGYGNFGKKLCFQRMTFGNLTDF